VNSLLPKRWSIIVPAGLTTTLLMAMIAILISTKPNSLAVPVARHSEPENKRTIRIAGTTEAVHMRAIIAPMLASRQVGSLTITKLVPGGKRVQRGDVLVEFDRQTQTREVIEKQAEYQNLANKVLEQQAKEDAARAKDETEIGQAESDLSKANLEMQKLELLSAIDAEKARQTLEEAKVTREQLRMTFVLKRQAAQAGIRLLEIQRDRAHQIMLHADKNRELMQIHAPIDGVVVLNTIWKQGKMGQVQEGDQIRPGVTFMQVVNPSEMQVRAFVNQEDFFKLQFGNAATIHLDAYPELVFPGKLEEMAPIARSGDFSSRLRTFAVVFSIEGSDPKLMPDLSAAIDVEPVAQIGAPGMFSNE